MIIVYFVFKMAEVEGANFDLLDRVSGLEQQIEEMKDQTSPEAEREYSETVDEQNQVRNHDFLKNFFVYEMRLHALIPSTFMDTPW